MCGPHNYGPRLASPHPSFRPTAEQGGATVMKRNARSQEVTDEQGRRRFHGAFTGGYSAGYFNSVGSKEGWTPSAFSSSRGARLSPSRFQQRPEDFMDEDDDPLLGKRLETTESYDTLQAGARKNLQLQQKMHTDRSSIAPVPAFALPEDWVMPANKSVGARLLQQMGWKEGHGIGQRVRKRKFHADDKNADEQKSEEAAAAAEEEVYVPPRNAFDVKKAFPKPKLDRYGAGFDPYVDAPEFSRYKQQKELEGQTEDRQVVTFADAMKASSGSNRATTGYGLGALEENDDLDVYGSVSMTEFDRAIAPLGAKESVKRLDSGALESRRHERHRQKQRQSQALCSDGRPVLPGFELATGRERPPKSVSLRLAVPSGFKAHHRFEEGEGQEDAVTALYRNYNFSASKHGTRLTVTAKQRAALLGEEDQDEASAARVSKQTAATGSVFDLLGAEQKAKLMGAAAQAKRGLPFVKAPHSAAAIAEEPATPKERQPLVRGTGGEQFRATISASIAKRFVSSRSTIEEEPEKHVEKQDESVAGLSQPPRAKVSRRSQSAWVPKALLCKRFHVKCQAPTGSNGKDDDERKRDLFDQELVPHLVEFAADRAARRRGEDESGAGSIGAGASLAGARQDNARGKTETAEELPPLPVVEKPAASLLKSIFEPSDESEESDEDESDDEEDEGEKGDGGKSGGANTTVPSAGSGLRSLSTVGVGEPTRTSRPGPLPTSKPSPLVARNHDFVSSDSSSSSDEDGPSRRSASDCIDTEAPHKRARAQDDGDGDKDEASDHRKHKKHKKQKKHHKHRSSRDEDKSRKRRKKDRKSHRSSSSRHSRRSRSRSVERSSRRHRSSSRRH